MRGQYLCLQMEHGLQTHTVPQTEPQRSLVARRMGFAAATALEDFESALELHASNVRRAYERAQMLFSERLIAQSVLDDAHSAVDVAENRKRAAQSQLAVSEAKVTEARAQVAQAKAVADRDAEDLANATIRAPIRATATG